MVFLKMGSPKHASQKSPARRSVLQRASCLFVKGFVFAGCASLALSLIWFLLCFINYHTSFHAINTGYAQYLDMHNDSAEPTFYDDPSISYSIGRPIKDWDEKRKEWLKHHPSLADSAGDRILLVTGSQASVCSNPVGDHLQLRFFKNKVDYCRLHGCDVFYNNQLLHPKVNGGWAKLPPLLAAMLAHPEVEWIWWVDSDAIFTDMDFKLPLEKYKHHNLVVPGWWHRIHDAHSWTGLNSGVFLIRNCQWSMNLIEAWISMGPQSPDYEKWTRIHKSMLKDMDTPRAGDQSSLIYLLTDQKEKWAPNTYLENKYDLHGYWLGIVDGFANITKRYMEVDREVNMLRRRHAEKVSQFYGTMRQQYLKGKGNWKTFLRRPFVTHFAGCQQCSGRHNPVFTWEACWNGMQKALNFADNQVLTRFGFVHPDLNSSLVSPLPLVIVRLF